MIPVLIAPQNPRYHTTTQCADVREKVEETIVTTRERAQQAGRKKCRSTLCSVFNAYDWWEDLA